MSQNNKTESGSTFTSEPDSGHEHDKSQLSKSRSYTSTNEEFNDGDIIGEENKTIEESIDMEELPDTPKIHPMLQRTKSMGEFIAMKSKIFEEEHDSFLKRLHRMTRMAKNYEEKSSNKWNQIVARISLAWTQFKRSPYWKYWLPLQNTVRSVERNFGAGIASFFQFSLWVIYINVLICIIWIGLVLWPWFVWPPITYSEFIQDTEPTDLTGFLGGSGMERLFMYYSGFVSQQGPWDMGLAYTLAILIGYLAVVAWVSWTISGTSSKQFRYKSTLRIANILFGMWDHSLSSKETIGELSRALSSRLYEEIVLIHKKKEKEESLPFKKELLLVLRRGFGIFTTLLLVLLGILGIWLVTTFQETLSGYFVFLPSILVTSINSIFPLIIRGLVLLEGYSEISTIEQNNIARIYFIKITNTFFLLFGIAYSQPTIRDDGSVICVETLAGKLFWQMTLTDLFVAGASMLFISLFYRYVWYRDRFEFYISSTVIEILNRQALVLVGVTVCPVLPILGTISNIILFYVNYISLKLFCKFPSTPMTASKSTLFFKWFLMLNLGLQVVPIAFFLRRSTSGLCGPHQNMAPIYELSRLKQEAPQDLQVIIDLILHPVVLLSLIVALGVLVYILWRRRRASGQQINALKRELAEEKLLKKQFVQEIMDTTA